MIVSESLNCVFIHIPKTGGSSVRTMLAPALDLSRDLDIRSRKSVRGTRAACGMDPAAAIIKHSRLDRLGKLLGPARLTSMFSFAVVRNPFARAWSALAFVKRRAVSHADQTVRPIWICPLTILPATCPRRPGRCAACYPKSNGCPHPNPSLIWPDWKRWPQIGL